MIAAAILTVAIEGTFLWLCGKSIDRLRSVLGLLYIALVNIFTNVSLNLSIQLVLRYYGRPRYMSLWIYLAEAAVVIAEYLLYLPVFGKSKRVFLLTLAANVLSYTAGIIIYGHI